MKATIPHFHSLLSCHPRTLSVIHPLVDIFPRKFYRFCSNLLQFRCTLYKVKFPKLPFSFLQMFTRVISCGVPPSSSKNPSHVPKHRHFGSHLRPFASRSLQFQCLEYAIIASSVERFIFFILRHRAKYCIYVHRQSYLIYVFKKKKKT